MSDDNLPVPVPSDDETAPRPDTETSNVRQRRDFREGEVDITQLMGDVTDLGGIAREMAGRVADSLQKRDIGEMTRKSNRYPVTSRIRDHSDMLTQSLSDALGFNTDAGDSRGKSWVMDQPKAKRPYPTAQYTRKHERRVKHGGR